MPKKYVRLTAAEREEVSRCAALGLGVRATAAAIGRAPSTVSRERRRPGTRDGYRAHAASSGAARAASSRRRGKTKLSRNARLRKLVESRLLLLWSPRQVAESLRVEYPSDMTMRISPEAVYDHIYVLPRGSLRKELVSALRRGHKYRRKAARAGGAPAETRGKIAEMLSIEERPAEAADRTVPGHWEGDLVVGRGKRSAIGTLVERTTRYAILVPLRSGKDAASVRRAYARALRSLPAELRRTLTYDQGKEMSQHREFTVGTGVKVYFAHPHSPWERGTNENTNGLVRQFFPKGTDFTKVTAREIKRAQRLLNGRPRMTLGWQKPETVFRKLVALNSRD